MRIHLAHVVVSGMLAITPASSQDSGPHAAPRELATVRTPIHEAPSDEGRSYGIWGAGAGYKASFHDGMTFVPYLGTAYPENLPISWRTVGVQAGGVPMLVPGSEPERKRSEYRYEYRHAGGVTEAYDVRLEGLEQTFVITRLPAAGDLVIRGAVSSRLTAANAPPAHQALEFRDSSGRPLVEYGAGIAFDSAGNTVEVLTGHEDGEITLTVPGSWLATAELPVVVDPLFGPVGIPQGSATTRVTDVDIAIDEEVLVWTNMIVHTRAASASDEDLWVHMYDSSYQNIALVFSDLASWSTDSPACSYVGGADRHVITFRRLFLNGESRIRARVHDRGSNTFGSQVAFLSAPAGWNHWRPDVGGVQSFNTGNDALIVFQVEDNTLQSGQFNNTARSQVQGVIFDPTTVTGTFGAPFPIASSPIADNERPSVNRIADSGNAQLYSWICAFQAYSGLFGPDDWDVLCRRVDNSGNIASGVFSSDIGTSNTRHQLGPIVEGSGGRYAVTFAAIDLDPSSPKPSHNSGSAIYIERFDWPDGSTDPTIDKPAVELTSSAFATFQPTGLAFDSDDRSHWCALWHEFDLPDRASRYAYVGYNGEPTELGSIHQPATLAQNLPCAGTFDFGAGRFAIASASDQYPAGNKVYLTIGLYFTAGGPWITGAGCSAAAIDWIGNQQIGAEFNGVQITGASPTSGHFLLVSLASTDLPITVPGVGAGCRLLVDRNNGYLGTMAFQFGERPFWQFPLPEWLTPTSLYFQDWILDGNQFLSTQRLEVPIIK